METSELVRKELLANNKEVQEEYLKVSEKLQTKPTFISSFNRRQSKDITKADRKILKTLEDFDKKYLKLQPYFDIITEAFQKADLKFVRKRTKRKPKHKRLNSGSQHFMDSSSRRSRERRDSSVSSMRTHSSRESSKEKEEGTLTKDNSKNKLDTIRDLTGRKTGAATVEEAFSKIKVNEQLPPCMQ